MAKAKKRGGKKRCCPKGAWRSKGRCVKPVKTKKCHRAKRRPKKA